ncbi:hypothetical protein N7474_004674 [Penicillium riverlandense]|uniref:uncharacterized protein n=1 Tax=Penicillium riverlandense TaxID=1903569 RepID=UPI0025495336|nr:uncharacterized protein N7474_004674 [Penicillium riverlandense]KAJ5819083.1 hypothetical protein N7474_004674 [Penicillium riverlandense]
METGEEAANLASQPPAKMQNPNRRRPKSKGGCARCKQRRRRCDETKPSCQECVKRGQECPGYQRPTLKWRHVFKENHAGDEAHTCAVGESSRAVLPSVAELVKEDSGIQPQGAANNTEPSSLFDHLPDIDASANALPRLESMTDGLAIVKTTSQTESLDILQERLANAAMPPFLINMPTILVQYYFDYVCKSWSSFDSPLNPFRRIFSRLWSQSAPVYFAIQSMAAASLANDFPAMRAIGIQTRQQAIACLENAHRPEDSEDGDDEYFLALLMIGMTTAWHNASDLGLNHLKEAKEYILQQRRRCQSPKSAFAKQYPLFKQCLLYWNMLAAFVAEDSPLLAEEEASDSSELELSVYLVDGQILPHPWTGSVGKVLSLFYRTARLIRGVSTFYRSYWDSLDLGALDVNYLVEEIELQQRAEQLEEEILSAELLSYSGLIETGDTNTPPSHFIILAEAYRCTALLQIYHVFPDILTERFRLNQILGKEPSGLFSMLFPKAHATNASHPSATDARRKLTLHIVSLLDQLFPSSGTRCMLPVLLAAIASDLVFSSESLFGPAANAIAGLSTLDVEIAQARRKVSMWISELVLILPKLPMQRISNLVRETWDRADDGCNEFWLDVMLEKNLGTIL